MPLPRLLLVVLFALGSALLPAQQTIDVEATAASESEAVEQALLEAIRRSVGVVSDDAIVTRRLSLMQAGLRTTLSAESKETERVRGVQTASKGVVEGYEVLERKAEGAAFHVKVRAKVARFDPKALRSEPFSVVLLPVRAKVGAYVQDIDGKSKSRELDLAPLAARMRAAVELQLVQSKVFTVLDRQDLALADAEFARIVGGECPPADLARLHQRLTADYLLLGEIVEATAQTEAVNLGELGWSARSGHVFALRYTLLEVATGRIARTGVIESRDWPQQRKVAPSPELDLEALFGRLAERTAPLLVDAFVGDVAPVMVALAKDVDGRRRVTLTQGGARFAPGDRYEAVLPGEPITHPVTGAVLGRDEASVGEIVIVDTSGPLAIGEVTQGGDKVARGAIVRRRLPFGVVLR